MSGFDRPNTYTMVRVVDLSPEAAAQTVPRSQNNRFQEYGMRQFGNTLVAADTWQLFRARLWWWVGGLGVVVSLVSLWASWGQRQQAGEPPAAIAAVVKVESQEPLVPLPLHVPGSSRQGWPWGTALP